MPPPIAIVGVSVELPSGSYCSENLDHKTFFDFLLSSGEAYEAIPVERFNIDAWKGPGIGKISIDKGSFLKGIDTFDNVEFGISSKDARSMSPAARKLLENSFLALLDSGIDYRMKKVGVYTSGTSIDLLNVSEPNEFDAQGSFAGYPSMIANRISNHLDLLGPSLPLDTACSSTLTAMHLAVQAISAGDCEAAIVGGCQLNHRFIDWVTYSQGSLLAKDGKCKPFDSHADGFSRAEGCAVVVIKPLEAAIRDHDHIYATVLGTAVNSTGSAAPPGAPVAESQRDAMVQAFERAGKNPREVDYVELHATGTAKGDPTEANWVGERFHRDDDLLVGSVKGNIGHTEITAFLASLSKVISIFGSKVIPPQVNIRNLNSAIKWEEYRLKVPLEPTSLPCRSGEKSLISIAGSGIGGSNGHVVLESPPQVIFDSSRGDSSRKQVHLIVAGGLSARVVLSLSQSIQESFATYSSDLPGLSTVLGRRSKQTTWRAYAISSVDQPALVGFTTPQYCVRKPNPLLYVFSGQGPQHKDMGRELFAAYPVFQKSVRDMDEVFQRVTGMSIIQDYGLFDDVANPPLPEIWPIALVLPSIAIFQIALFDLLMSLGLTPDAVVGHSAGETAVLYACGAASKEMAVELAIIRGRSFTPIEKLGGTMAALACTEEELGDILFEYRKLEGNGLVELACFNAPSAVAIAGEEAAIDSIVRLAEGRGKFARKIRTRVPFHSSMMKEAEDDYKAGLKALFERYPGPHSPQIPVYSTLTGTRFETSFDADYFWNNTVSPVHFTQAMESIHKSIPSASFVEISPHPVLASYVVSMASESSTVLHSVQRPKRGQAPTEVVDILHLCGKLTVAGHNSVDFTALNQRSCSEFDLRLPQYPFSKKRYPLYPDTPGVHKQLEAPLGPLNSSYLRMNKETHPMLAEHVIRGEPIMPAAGFLEMALEFGASTLMNVNMKSILSLSSGQPVKVDVRLDGAHWSVKSMAASKSRKDNGPSPHERLHAEGFLSFETPRPALSLDLATIRGRCVNHVGSGFYPSLSYFSSYGVPFQRVTNLFYNQSEALASIKGMDSALARDPGYLLHPAILDACIQVTAYKPFHGDYDPNIYYLPAHVDVLIVHQRLVQGYFPNHVYAHVELKKWVPDAMHYDISLVDDEGRRLCTFIGLQVAKHRINPLLDEIHPLEVSLQPVFHAEHSTSPANHQRADRSNLFGSLDKMTIKAKMQRKGGKTQSFSMPKFGMDQRWSPFFDTLSITELMSPTDGPQFDEAIEISMRSLRTALRDMVQSGGQMARMLVVSNVKSGSLPAGIELVAKEFPGLYLDLSIDNKQSSQLLPQLPSGMVRHVHTSFTSAGLDGVNDHIFDVVVFFNVTGGDTFPVSIARAAAHALVPGGTLILTERNLEAWSLGSLGTMWYDATFGAPNSSNTFPSGSYTESLKSQDFTSLRFYDSDDCDPFHFTLACQKKPWSTKTHPQSPLFNASDDFSYHYSYGSEADIQWELSSLNDAQSLNIWIMATDGIDGAAAQGLVRALRREYISWTIRLVVFPASYDDDMRLELLERFPVELEAERDIIIPDGMVDRLLVPRLIPGRLLPRSLEEVKPEASCPPTIAHNHVLVRTLSSSRQGPVSGILATVVDSNATEIPAGSLVAALTDLDLAEIMVLDVTTLVVLQQDLRQHTAIISSLLHGFAAIALAIGPSILARPDRLKSLRILLTHCDTVVGTSAREVLSCYGVAAHTISQHSALSDLAKLQSTPYDLVISGYTDVPHIQVLKTLMSPTRGRIFLWDDESAGLAGLLRKEPWSVADALRCVATAMGSRLESICMSTETHPSLPAVPSAVEMPVQNLSRGAAFDKAKTYLIVGGIGTLGAHLALFMYQRGARHIIVTSRSGRKSLENNPNAVVRRMFSYLEAQEDLTLSFRALDGTDKVGMRTLTAEIGHAQIGGCIVLSAVLADGLFRHLTEKDFSTVFAAKIGVLEALEEAVDLELLDFIVSFTSVSGLIGFGGQTNYGAANTALEYKMSQLPNGFAFVCPGVLDSTLMLAGTDKSNETRLNALIPWSISAEDTMRWFDDAMFRHQSGQRIVRYVPDLNWEALDQTLGMPRLGEHLLASQAVEVDADVDDTARMMEIIKGVLAIPTADFSPDTPLTTYGIDSLSASRISFLLRPIVEVSQIQLLADLTLNDIHRLSLKDMSVKAEVVDNSKLKVTKTKPELMNDMLAKYAPDAKLASSPVPLPSMQPEAEVVLITGTTGTLGSNVLSHLLQNTDIKTVYAVNRTQRGVSLFDRHCTSFSRQGLDVSLLDSTKLVLLEADLTVDDLGLTADVAQELLRSVTHIIHNAWAVDFATSLADHEDLIKGTQNLLAFAQRSTQPQPPSLSYVSTIGTYQNVTASSREAFGNEAPILDPRVSVQTGYIESKWVAERLFQLASEKCGLRTNVIRVGLLTSGSNGNWDTSQWFPAIVQSAAYVGCLPEGDDTVSWIPVDLAAAAIMDMRNTQNETLHLVHPKPTTWNSLMQPLAKTLGVPLVPYVEWFARLESSARDVDDLTSITHNKQAALKLIHFYQIGLNASGNTESCGLLARVASDKGISASTTLRDEAIAPLDDQDAQSWVRYWQSIGFLP